MEKTEENDINFDLDEWKTDRLILKISNFEDFDELAPMLLDYNITRYLLEIPMQFQTAEDSKNFLIGLKNMYSLLFTIRILETKEAIGQVGFVFEKKHEISIIYWIGIKYQQKGYASEATIKLTNYIFKRSNANKMIIEFCSDNLGSAKLASKIKSFILKENPKFISTEETMKKMNFVVTKISDGKVDLECFEETTKNSKFVHSFKSSEFMLESHFPSDLLHENAKFVRLFKMIEILKNVENES